MAVPVTPEVRSQARKAGAPLVHPPIPDFVYLVSPSEVEMRAGEMLPRLVRFAILPGCMGVPQVRDENEPPRWEGAVADHCRRSGRTLVDCARFGIRPKVDGVEVEPADGEDPADPRVWYVRRYRGHKGSIHVSVWQRPRVLGSQVLWDVDEAGMLDFRRQIVEKMFPGGTVDDQIASVVRFAAEREVAALEAEAKHNPRATYNAEVARAALGGKPPSSTTKPAHRG
jgi:hypothetical protein